MVVCLRRQQFGGAHENTGSRFVSCLIVWSYSGRTKVQGHPARGAKHPFDYEVQGSDEMPKAVKYAEETVTLAAKGAWGVFEKLNSIRPNPSFTPKWSDKPLLKS